MAVHPLAYLCRRSLTQSTAALTHCQMAFFVQFAIAVDFRHDSGPLSIPCRWAFLLGSERGFRAAKWRLKGNRQSIPVDLAVKPEIRSRSLHDFGLRLVWLLCNDFGEEFTTPLKPLCCPSDARFCA